MTTATVEQPVDETKIDPLTLGGDAFAARSAAGKAKAAEEAAAEPEKPADTVKPDAKVEPAKPAPVVKGKTPLDLPAKEKPEPAHDEDEISKVLAAELPANASASAKSSHAILRKGYEREHGRVKELTAQLEELKGKAPSPAPELEARLKAAEELNQKRELELEHAAFERSPKYQQFNKAIDNELAAAKSYVEGSEVDPNLIELASRATGAKRIQLLSEANLDPDVKAAIMPHLARMDAINRDRAAAQEDWKGTHAQWESEQRAAQDKQAALVREHEDKVFSTVGKKLAETVPAWKPMDGNEEWNADLQRREAKAREVFDGKVPLEETSEVIRKGIAFDITEASRVEAVSRLNEALAEIERIKAASPGAGSAQPDRGGGVASTGNPIRDAENTFNEMKSRMGA